MGEKKMNPAEREKRVVIRAGLFVALGLLLSGAVVFVIGKERRMFERAHTYTGAFENVDGLALESPVRLGGLQVGKVSKITFAPDLGDKRIIVTMEVSRRFQERVRVDSVARITGRGVLGDKAIDVSLGSPDKPFVPNGGELLTGTSGDITSLMKVAGEFVDNAVGITRDLRTGVQAFTSPELTQDVTRLVRSLRAIAGEIEGGKGLVHSIIYDPSLSQEMKLLLSRGADVATRLDGAVTKADAILGDVKSGQGSLHALIYDKQMANAVADLGRAAEEVAELIHDAKTSPDGAVHQLVYGKAQGMMTDLAATAADLKSITGTIQRGEGSLGALIKDPTVYDDLREVLGNVKRNRVLRELVRMSISNTEKVDAAGKSRP
jgi:phospholipid/cholesterol/gamma-HCH transport system substrate-binding protein